MIPKHITAPFRWGANLPWMAFWGITLVLVCTITLVVSTIDPLGHGFIAVAYAICLPVLVIAWILSFGRGMFVTWQRSKIRAVLIAVAALLIVVGILAAIVIPGSAAYRARAYDADVKANLKNAAKAQAAYYRDNGTYTANIDSLRGFNQSDYVTITVEATETTFVITGTKTIGCKADTGTWSINSTDGSISGTPCR